MAVNYASTLKTTRMAAVITALDVSAGAATLKLYTSGDVEIVSITLADPSFTESGGIITMAGVPKSGVASLAGTNTATKAIFKTGDAASVITGLTVGAGSGDINLNSNSITQGQTVTITAGTITHAA